MRNTRLTGKTRHRETRFRKKLIMQVEERGFVEDKPARRWRDGTMDDLLELIEMRVPRKVRRGNA